MDCRTPPRRPDLPGAPGPRQAEDRRRDGAAPAGPADGEPVTLGALHRSHRRRRDRAEGDVHGRPHLRLPERHPEAWAASPSSPTIRARPSRCTKAPTAFLPTRSRASASSPGTRCSRAIWTPPGTSITRSSAGRSGKRWTWARPGSIRFSGTPAARATWVACTPSQRMCRARRCGSATSPSRMPRSPVTPPRRTAGRSPWAPWRPPGAGTSSTAWIPRVRGSRPSSRPRL